MVKNLRTIERLEAYEHYIMRQIGHLQLFLAWALLRMSRPCLLPFQSEGRERFDCSSPMNLGFDPNFPGKLLGDEAIPVRRLLGLHVAAH